MYELRLACLTSLLYFFAAEMKFNPKSLKIAENRWKSLSVKNRLVNRCRSHCQIQKIENRQNTDQDIYQDNTTLDHHENLTRGFYAPTIFPRFYVFHRKSFFITKIAENRLKIAENRGWRQKHTFGKDKNAHGNSEAYYHDYTLLLVRCVFAVRWLSRPNLF